MYIKQIMILICLFLNLVFAVTHAELPLSSLTLPPGFSISLYATDLKAPREMALGDKNTLFVGSSHAGNVYAVVKDDKSATGTKVLTIATDLNMPNGVAFRQGALYVAEIDRVLRYDNIEDHLENPPKPIIINKQLPKEKHHGMRYIHFGPDQKLYFGIGAPCNNCLNDNAYFATIARMNADGKQLEIFAHGVRNTVGFDWHPATKQLWFTDNGRDMLGDDSPSDELNIAAKKGMHFGFPYCHGKTVSDPTFGKLHPCNKFTPPVFEFPAHVATLGMVFYRGTLFPPEYHQQIFVAEHGSWNRSTKVGYQVVAVKLHQNGKVKEAKPFISGWLKDGEVWGRPVDILTLRDGSLLISDDFANVIYRVHYKK